MSIPRNKFWITVTFATATKPKILFWRMLWVPGPHHSREKTPKDTWDPQPGPRAHQWTMLVFGCFGNMVIQWKIGYCNTFSVWFWKISKKLGCHYFPFLDTV